MTESTSFADAMMLTALDRDGDVRTFGGVLNEHWTIGAKVHGGAMLALSANAARTAIDVPGVEPITVSASFLWAPDPGPMQAVCTVRKRGRRVSVVDVELTQEQRVADERSREEHRVADERSRGEQRVADERSREEHRVADERSREEHRVAVRSTIALAEPEHADAAPLLSVNPVVALMPPEPPRGLAGIGLGHPMADIVHLARGCDIRPSLRSLTPPADGGPPVIQYWVRPRDGSPDALFALLCGDVSAPVTFSLNRFGWAPTVQLTAYLRGLPADGWLRVICTTTQIGQDWFDEDHVVVDCEGRIVVQSRQLALVPPPV